MDFNNEAKVVECIQKEYDGRVYYTLMVMGDNVPLSKVNSNRPYKVGDVVHIGFRRREADMKLGVTVL